ncbi:MAG TPA: nucleotidyltransferase family protein [Thermoanaerobaculia bacterium]|nr:nucleotidyltransferase family protein [Thermoanaerobaculia bacterium]
MSSSLIRETLLAVARGERVRADVDGLAEAAALEGMTGLLARAATASDRRLTIQGVALEARASGMLHELARVTRAFAEAGVAILSFKGPVLSQQLYGAAGMRASSDLDLVVAPRDAAAGEAILESLGYHEAEALNASQRRTHRRFGGASLFSADASGVPIDFHWTFSNEQFPLRLSFDDAWQRRAEVRIGEATFATLGDADLVVTTCSHAAKHLWHRLEFLAQIAALAKRDCDWSAVERVALEAGAAKQVGLSFLLVRELLGVPAPPLPRCLALAEPRLPEARRLVEASLFRGEHRHGDATARYLLLLLDRRRDALRSLLLAVFVPTHSDWRGARGPHWLQWLRRPLRLLLRTIR